MYLEGGGASNLTGVGRMGANVDWGECGLGAVRGESRIWAVSPICVGRIWKGAVRPSDSGANPVLGL